MQIWEEFLKSLEKELGVETVQRWARPLEICNFDARNLYLEAKDPLQINWFEEYIRPRLRLVNNNGIPIQVHLQVPAKKKMVEDKPSYTILPDRLDAELTFENFVGDQMAYRVLRGKEPFNPIYLYGAPHTGKTHLLTAFALASKGKVFYVRGETFTSHVVQAIRLGLMQQFRQIYRAIDLLLVDDIHVLAGRQATQEEFFHTFNTLQMAGKQIIVAGNAPPSQLKDIEPRLMSRFEWGISIKVEGVDAKELLQKKAKLWNLSYDDVLLERLAETFPQNPLVALQALALRAKGLPLTTEKALSLVQDLIAQERVTLEEIIEAVALHFGIIPQDLVGKSQAREHAHPRQIAMFIMREKLKLPFQKIAKHFGRDHSTVMASIERVHKNLEDLVQDLERIEEKLYNAKHGSRRDCRS
jgi:chromosomal replication initiator protein